MRKYLIVALLIIVNTAIAQNWTATSSIVGFKIKMLGVNVDGTLKGMKTNLKFMNGEPSALSASIDSKTINTSNNLRDKHLKEKEEFFQPDIFPNISMSSTSIQKISEGKYTGTFKLTIKNITKNIKIPFTFTEESNKGLLKTDFTINRQDWNFGGDTPGMSENVKIAITLNMVKN